MYLGMHISSLGIMQKPSFAMVIDCAQALEAKLIAKPHIRNEVSVWQDFADRQSKAKKVEVVFERIESILRESDIMIVSHWSTALIEAALSGTPVIILDLYGCAGAVNYAPRFLTCAIVKTEDDLRNVLDVFVKHGAVPPIFSEPKLEDVEYFVGKKGGNAAVLVAESILEGMNR